MDLRTCKDHTERRTALEKHLNISLNAVGASFNDDLSNVHCENLIGSVTIPLGVAGPIVIKGERETRDEVYIPLATSEGALVASVNRGSKAIALSGGALVSTSLIGATRGPVFETKGIKESRELERWIQQNITVLQTAALSTSSHLALRDAFITINGKYVYVRFAFDTHDAMGMNMVTIATDTIAEIIEKETKTTCLALAGNYDIDKKPAWLNMIAGRGRKGWGEVIIPRDVVEKVLKTTPERLSKVVLQKCWGGSMLSGSMGFNAHFANIVAAFFAATGQDLAHVVEGSTGITTAEVLDSGDLYFSVYLPSIMIGTVGGGTKLKTQTEARAITNAQTADELSEVLIAAVLAGELSLLASITESSLARAHKKLGR